MTSERLPQNSSAIGDSFTGEDDSADDETSERLGVNCVASVCLGRSACGVGTASRVECLRGWALLVGGWALLVGWSAFEGGHC